MGEEGKRRPGQPTKLNARVHERIMDLAEQGKTDVEIAAHIGVDVRTLYFWKKKNRDFFQSLKAAKNIADDLVEAALFQRALGYSHREEKVFCFQGEIITTTIEKYHPPCTAAGIFWLKNRKPEMWRDKPPESASSDEDSVYDTEWRALATGNTALVDEDEEDAEADAETVSTP